MRIMEYLSSGAMLIIAFTMILLIAGIFVAVFDAVGINIEIDINAYRWVIYIAGAGFILAVVFEYVYNLIVGEDR